MEPFIGQIIMFGGNFAPRGWAYCNGQLLSISNYSALYSLLGTTYGGDGRTTFALPDLRGRVPIHAGQGEGLTERRPGEKGGAEFVTLNVNEMPAHKHKGSGTILASDKLAEDSIPKDKVPSVLANNVKGYSSQPTTSMRKDCVEIIADSTGGNQPHNNMPPFQAVNYIIALEGIYPQRG